MIQQDWIDQIVKEEEEMEFDIYKLEEAKAEMKEAAPAK